MSVESEERFTTAWQSLFRQRAAAQIGLAVFLFSALLSVASAQPAAPTCRTPDVDARIAELTKQIGAIDAQEDTIRAELTDRALKGSPVSHSDAQPKLQSFEQQKQPLQAELAQLERLPPCQPPTRPLVGYSPLYNAPFYNAPWDGGGFYFGPTGSLSALQDSNLIKRLEPRTSDTIFSMPRSITGTSTNWASSSSPWLSSSNFGRLNTEGGSKTRVLSSSIGYNVGARAGYRVGDFRFEGEFDYANNDADTLVNPRRIEMSDIIRREDILHGSTTGMTFLFNAIYDFNLPALGQYGFTPHILGGIGAGQISTDLKWGDRTIVNASGWNVAYNLGAGLQYKITPTLSIDLDYRYRGIADVTLRNDFEKINVPYSSHNFLASLTYQLPWGAAAAPPYWAPPPAVTPYTPPPQQPPWAYPTQRF